MKKLLVVLTLALCITPVFAQKGKVGKEIIDATAKGGRALEDTAKLGQIVKQLIQSPGTQIASFVNIPGKPRVLIEMPEAELPRQPKLLSAQVLNGEEFRQGVFPEYKFRHLPEILNSRKPALYRGMALGRLKDFKNILQNGLEKDKSYFDKLYFSADIDMALSCANEEHLLLPAVVKVEVTPELKLKRPFSHDVDDNYVFPLNIPAEYITNVLTYLEIDNKRGWYEVFLKDGELMFKPVLSLEYTKEDLIVHKFNQSPSIPSYFSGDWW